MKRLLLLFLLFPLLASAQHTVSGTFTPAETYPWGILYRVSETQFFYTVDTRMSESGHFVMELNEEVTPGMYRFVYGVPQEEKSFELIYNGKENIELNFSEEEGLTFIASEENTLLTNYKKETVAINALIGEALEQNPDAFMNPLLLKQKSIQEDYETRAKGMFSENFIVSNRSHIPASFSNKEDYLKDQKDYYFQYIDPSNPALQKSEFLFNKAYSFIENKDDIETVAAFLQPANKEFQKSLLVKIWQQLVNDNRIDLANKLGSSSLTSIALELNDEELVSNLKVFEQTSIGSKAPDFSWKDEDEKTHSLYNLEDAEQYVLVFWSSTCSHCLKELPKLHSFLDTLKEEKYQVIAFGIEDEIYNWRNEILRLPNFLHVPGLGKWDNETSRSYGISQTPTYYVLNKDKVIIAKPEELDDLIEVLKD